ncbi:MAG TPA: 5'-nucleotidase C-terminal domain-containing protein, partial [Vicinamibacterales bacterium]|nr:5'-nucleotidase C-terminal domain-containing protein [Vicinamibacterales bacterium]
MCAEDEPVYAEGVPEAADVEPEATADDPEAADVEPEATAHDPEAADVEPEAAAHGPEAADVDSKATAEDSEAAAELSEAVDIEFNPPDDGSERATVRSDPADMLRKTSLRAALVVVALALVGSLDGGRFASLSGALVRRVAAQQDEAGSPRRLSQLTILQINDVYSTVPINDVGGLARVATLKQRVSAQNHPVILALAGDFLSPSVASTVFKGEQMIATLNAAGLDYATLGNHEFDFGIDVLKQRMSESKFTWVVSNVLDAKGKTIGPAVPYVVRQIGPLKIGIIGLCITTSTIAPAWKDQFRFTPAADAAAQYLPMLKRAGADAVVALTHLTFAEDRQLAAAFPQIDVIVGGHEHYPLTATESHTLISKAGSDARFVARIDLLRTSGPRGVLERFFELVPMTNAIPSDPATAAVADSFETRLGTELDTVVGTSTVPLDATDRRLVGETALGNLVADALRDDVNADVGLSNAGGARGSRVYPAGPLTRRTLLSIHPFGNVTCKVAVSGRVLLEALNHGVSKLPGGAGQFPQISGVTMHVDTNAPSGARVT